MNTTGLNPKFLPSRDLDKTVNCRSAKTTSLKPSSHWIQGAYTGCARIMINNNLVQVHKGQTFFFCILEKVKDLSNVFTKLISYFQKSTIHHVLCQKQRQLIWAVYWYFFKNKNLEILKTTIFLHFREKFSWFEYFLNREILKMSS